MASKLIANSSPH
ncbi:unnamed protein product [Linum tenue]|uniref:Uncharacterized protein n=1 Tax=Linum tenue TaxID=586396 RepID=A0AAV0LJN3_9ROSI|nr:unnamed protein product [Linum tenue]CAI0434395.1 unnamed protein product [Linum tenue]